MADLESDRNLALNDDRRDGTLTLPGCQLIIKYICTDARQFTDLSIPEMNSNALGESKVLEKFGHATVSRTIGEICKELVSVLEEWEEMGKPTTRDSLLNGFTTREKNLVKRDDSDMHIDLRNIVECVARRLEKLDKLTVNAIDIIFTPSIQKKLNKILREYELLKSSVESQAEKWPEKPESEEHV